MLTGKRLLKSAASLTPVGTRPQREQLSEKSSFTKIFRNERYIGVSTPSMTTGQRTLYLLLLTKTFGIGCNLESVRLKMHLLRNKAKVVYLLEW